MINFINRWKNMYYVIVTNGGGRNIAVAVEDNPAGPFKVALGKPLAGPN